jgi:hypothetical protein
MGNGRRSSRYCGSCAEKLYNAVRLHSAIAYLTPADKLADCAEAIWVTRRQKLAVADARRQAKTKDRVVDQPLSCDVR